MKNGTAAQSASPGPPSGASSGPSSDPSSGPSAGRSRLPLWPLAIFALLAVLFFLALQGGDPSRLPSTLIGRPAPPTSLPALEDLVDAGRAVPGFSNADLAAGEVTVVNFWASWCVPCVQEHPVLVALKARTGVRIYGVNYKDQAATARRFLGRYGNPFTAVGVDASGRTAIDWGVTGMPETFVLNGNSEIVYKHIGPLSAETLESTIIPAIKAAAAR